MLYVFLLYSDPSVPPPPDDLDLHLAFADEARRSGVYVTSEALGSVDSATTVRVRDGRTLTTDGPFSETKEVLGGLYVLECKDLDDALAQAARIPVARNGSVEVRPIMHVPGWDYAIPGDRQPFS